MDGSRVRRGLAVVTLIAAFLLALAVSPATAPRADAAVVERTLGSAVVDSSRSQAPKWRRLDFTTSQTATATFRLAWSGNADLRFEIRLGATGAIIASNTTTGTSSPKTVDASLTAGTAYYAAIWAYSGVGTYTLTIAENIPDPPPPGGSDRTLSTGSLDSTRASAAKWVRVDFTTPRTATTALRLSWTGNADLRIEIRLAATGAIIARNITAGTTSPKTVDAPLTAGTAYYAAVWSYRGVAAYTLTIADGTVDPPPPGTRPNVVVIDLDDMNAVSLAYLPKINDWLVDGGTTFPNAYVSTPSCCPSRSTLMSGRYVHNNGQINQNNVGMDNDLTLQRYLRDAGYFTGHSGKYLHWWPLGSIAPHWDRWTYFKGGYENIWINFDGEGRQPPGYSTTIVFDQAIDYLADFDRRDDSRPFYMQLAPVAPHSPSIAEAKYASAAVPPAAVTPAHTETDRSDKPPFVINRTVNPSEIASTRTAMIRTLYSVDDQVDRFMRALQASGELDNTLVIFTSDNGYMWGEHGLGSKFLPYDPAVNVPFVIRWPGKVAAGVIDERAVTHVDIVPTVLAATGVTQNLAPVDGHDILGGHAREAGLTEYYYDTANGNGIPTWAAVRTADYLYVEYYGTSPSTTSTPTYREYYDMVTDPFQLVNLYRDGNGSNDPDTESLSAQLDALKSCSGNVCP